MTIIEKEYGFGCVRMHDNTFARIIGPAGNNLPVPESCFIGKDSTGNKLIFKPATLEEGLFWEEDRGIYDEELYSTPAPTPGELFPYYIEATNKYMTGVCIKNKTMRQLFKDSCTLMALVQWFDAHCINMRQKCETPYSLQTLTYLRGHGVE